MKSPLVSILYLSSLLLISTFANASTVVEQAESELTKASQQAAQTQAKIDALDEQTTEDYYRYRETLHRAEQVESYNKQLSRLVDSQTRELKSLKAQIASLEEIDQAALPLLVNMKDMLARFINNDLPFLQDERSTRLAQLQSMLDRADISLAEKYRQILEAYQIEVEYGRTLEAYNGQLAIASVETDKNTTIKDVTFLKLGRIALYYQTSDGQESGAWNKKNNRWDPLPPNHRWSIQKAIQLARQQTVPELLDLPLLIDSPFKSRMNP